MTLAVALLGVAVALLAALVISLLRSHADILRALEELGVSLDPDSDDANTASPSTRQNRPASDPVTAAGTVEGVASPAEMLGHVAADITGLTPKGDATTIGVGSEDLLIAFLSTGCITCHRFWEAFSTGDQLTDGRLQDGTRVVVVTQGVESETPAKVDEFAPADVPVVMSSDAWEDFGVPLAPYFALVVGGRVVGEGAAAQWSQVASLLERARQDAVMHAGGRNQEAENAPRSRRSVITGNRDRIDADLLAAGIRPGDPRLNHTAADVGLGDASLDEPSLDEANVDEAEPDR